VPAISGKLVQRQHQSRQSSSISHFSAPRTESRRGWVGTGRQPGSSAAAASCVPPRAIISSSFAPQQYFLCHAQTTVTGKQIGTHSQFGIVVTTNGGTEQSQQPSSHARVVSEFSPQKEKVGSDAARVSGTLAPPHPPHFVGALCLVLWHGVLDQSRGNDVDDGSSSNNNNRSRSRTTPFQHATATTDQKCQEQTTITSTSTDEFSPTSGGLDGSSVFLWPEKGSSSATTTLGLGDHYHALSQTARANHQAIEGQWHQSTTTTRKATPRGSRSQQ